MVSLRKTMEPEKRIQITILKSFYAFLIAFNLFLLLTNKNIIISLKSHFMRKWGRQNIDCFIQI